MSHTLKMSNVKLDLEKVKQAAAFLKLRVKENQTVQFYDHSTAKGLAVELPGWRYPLVIGNDGQMTYDNYNGQWGKTQELQKLTGYALAAMAEENLSELLVEQRGSELIFATDRETLNYVEN